MMTGILTDLFLYYSKALTLSNEGNNFASCYTQVFLVEEYTNSVQRFSVSTSIISTKKFIVKLLAYESTSRPQVEHSGMRREMKIFTIKLTSEDESNLPLHFIRENFMLSKLEMRGRSGSYHISGHGKNNVLV